MILWLAIVAMTTATLGTLLMAVFEPTPAQEERADYDLEVLMARLREIERDAERNLIDKPELETARIEIKRSILAADRGRSANYKETGPTMRKTTAAALTVLLPPIALGLYAFLGSPDLGGPGLGGPEQSTGKQTEQARPELDLTPQTAVRGLDSVDTMVARLIERLEQEPEDVEGWRTLGWSYLNLEQFPEAVGAYRRAVVLRPDSADLQAAYGEAAVRAANGLVTPQALGSFERAIALDPTEPRARFFIGLSRKQSGDKAGALDLWTEILKTAPTNAEWRPDLEQRAADLAKELGQEPVISPPQVGTASRMPQPTGDDIRAAEEMSPEAREEMIHGMVERLAQRLEDDPEDSEGWIRLARSRLVLGEGEAAQAALHRALTVFADRPAVQEEIRTAARQLAIELKD